MVTQISVFIENQPGRAAHLTRLLTESGLNIRGYMISDTSDFGIVRLVVDDPDRACRILHEHNAICQQSSVLVIRLEDTPGELARLFDVLADHELNVVYSYSLISTFVAISTDDPSTAASILDEAGFTPVSHQDLSADMCNDRDGA